MKINSYFNDFLSDIRLTQSQRDDLIKGHSLLRERLDAFNDLKDIIVTTFLQGSYRRATAIRPLNGKRADVDIIIVTNLDKNSYTPEEAIQKFVPFVEKHYKGKYRVQGRSIGIELAYVDLDIVVTSAPSESDKRALQSKSVNSLLNLEDFPTTYDWKLSNNWVEPDIPKGLIYLSESLRAEAEWKTSPLWIPDRDADEWVETHPLEQIRWTRDKNKNTNKHYVNVVKAIKWWRTLKLTDFKYPKGYPIEHMVGDCCPDSISSVAEGVWLTFENIVSTYKQYRQTRDTPSLYDRGVPSHDVWKRVASDDFCSFYDSVNSYVEIARNAINAESLKDQVGYWREIFRDKFPLFDGDDNKGLSAAASSGSFTPRTENAQPERSRFA